MSKIKKLTIGLSIMVTMLIAFVCSVAGVNAVKNFLSALGIASPGTMQRKLVKEMKDTGDRIPVESQNLIRNIGIVGKNAVKSFGNPKLSVGFDSSDLNELKSSQLDFSNNSLFLKYIKTIL